MNRSEYPPCKWASVSACPLGGRTWDRASDRGRYSRQDRGGGGGGKSAGPQGPWGVALVKFLIETSKFFQPRKSS